MGKDAKPVPEISYYPSGAMRYTGYLLDGASHGAWEFLRLDGSTMRTGSFEKGKQVGIWRTFDRSGRLVKETRFGGGEEAG